MSVIEEAIGIAVHRTCFLSGCIDQGAGSIPGMMMTMFSHGAVRVPSREKVKSADGESRELRIHHRYRHRRRRRENIPNAKLGALQIFYSSTLTLQYTTLSDRLCKSCKL